MEFLIFIVLGFLLIWLFVVLPQRRRIAAHERLVESIKPGDEIVTAGGLYGDVTEVGEDEVALEIAPGVEVRVAMRAIGAVIPPDAYDDEDVTADQDQERPVRESGPVEAVRGNREVPTTHDEAPSPDPAASLGAESADADRR